MPDTGQFNEWVDAVDPGKENFSYRCSSGYLTLVAKTLSVSSKLTNPTYFKNYTVWVNKDNVGA